MSNKNPLLSFLGLCRRAGKMTLGNDIVTDSIVNGESVLVLIASDISPNTEKQITRNAQQYRVKLIKLKENKEDISHAVGKFSAVISINDSGFAKKIIQLTAQQ